MIQKIRDTPSWRGLALFHERKKGIVCILVSWIVLYNPLKQDGKLFLQEYKTQEVIDVIE